MAIFVIIACHVNFVAMKWRFCMYNYLHRLFLNLLVMIKKDCLIWSFIFPFFCMWGGTWWNKRCYRLMNNSIGCLPMFHQLKYSCIGTWKHLVLSNCVNGIGYAWSSVLLLFRILAPCNFLSTSSSHLSISPWSFQLLASDLNIVLQFHACNEASKNLSG